MCETTSPDLIRLLKQYQSEHPHRALGGLRALSGFEYQLRSYLADFGQALVASEAFAFQQGGEHFAYALEALSDHTRTDGDLTVCVQVKSTLWGTGNLANAAVEFAIVDAFLEDQITADQYARIRYECVARRGETTLDWVQVKLPAKIRSSRPDLQLRFEALLNSNRILPPRIEPDPWWRLIAEVHADVDDPFAFAREALDISLSRGLDAGGASRVRNDIADRFFKRRTSAAAPYDYLTPKDITLTHQVSPDVEVGIAPTLPSLLDAQFMERPNVLSQVRTPLDALVSEREGSPTYWQLDVLWIDGRSGSGKSVLLLQLMASLVRDGSRVVWLRDRAGELLELLKQIEAHAPTDGPEYVFIDDLYAPEGRSLMDLNEIGSLITHGTKVNWPVVVTCGPPEFHQALADDSGRRGIRLHPWRIPAVDAEESKVLQRWFNERTGHQPLPGPAFEQDEGLIVSMMFELRYGDLEPLAHRFRRRLEQASLRETLYMLFALNRLYIWSPAQWLDDEQRENLEVVNQDTDFTFLSTISGSGGYLKLTLPHLSDVIYRVIRRPWLPRSCADDFSGAFAKALETDVLTALRLMRVFTSGHDRLNVVDPARLADRCADHWREAGGAAAIAEPSLAAELRVLWAVWSAAHQSLDKRLGYASLTDACTALGTDHARWVPIWHTLAAAYPGHQAPLKVGLAWIRDPRHFAAPYWSIQWESLLDSDWSKDRDGQIVCTSLIALGREWLRGRESLPDWNYVWQRLVQIGDRLTPGLLEDLLRQGVDWSIGREETPGWAHVWEHLIQYRRDLPSDVSSDRLFRIGAEWLKDREDAPGWTFVWEYLLKYREALPNDIDSAALFRAGAEWLHCHEDAPGWPHICLLLIEHQNVLSNGVDLEGLFRTGTDWLNGHEDVPGWSNFWKCLVKHRRTQPCGANDVENLLRAGEEWLRGHQDAPGWHDVLYSLVKNVKASKNMVNVERVWQLATSSLRGRLDDPESIDVLQFLMRHREDPWVEGDSETILKDTATWIMANLDHPHVPALAVELIFCGKEGDEWLDELAGCLARWLVAHGAEPAGVSVLHALAVRGVGARQQEDAQSYGSGWSEFERILQAITQKRRSLLDVLTVGEKLTGKITSHSKSGYSVHLGEGEGLSAFLPRSQIALSHPFDGDALIGTSLELEIVEIDRDSLSIKVSQRTLVERALMETIAIGQVINARVANVEVYGLFVDVGGIKGLLHRSLLLRRPTGRLRNHFQRGESIRVEVIKVDREHRHIGLAEVPGPESGSDRPPMQRILIDALEVGQVLEGSIADIVIYGLFVDLGGVSGLLHRSKLIDQSDGDLRDRFAERQSIWVQVSKLHRDGRIGLAQVSDPEGAREKQRARRALLESLTPGQVFEGAITSIVDFGLFVDLGGSLEGLLSRANLLDPPEGNLNERYQSKQKILVEVLDLDVKQQRIVLAERLVPPANEKSAISAP